MITPGLERCFMMLRANRVICAKSQQNASQSEAAALVPMCSKSASKSDRALHALRIIQFLCKLLAEPDGHFAASQCAT